MKRFFDSLSMLILSVILITAISFSTINAQSRIYEDIGSSSGNQNVDSKTDNTLIYVGVGLIVGFVVYQAFFVKPKADKKAEDNKDSKDKPKTLAEEFQEFQNEMPIDLHIGIQNNQYIRNQKQFVMGVSFKL